VTKTPFETNLSVSKIKTVTVTLRLSPGCTIGAVVEPVP
jgi:hypothetical protein